jgi:hypothetical protein
MSERRAHQALHRIEMRRRHEAMAWVAVTVVLFVLLVMVYALSQRYSAASSTQSCSLEEPLTLGVGSTLEFESDLFGACREEKEKDMDESTGRIIDDEEHTDPEQEDIGDLTDLDGDGIPDELEVDDLDDLVAQVDPDAIDEPDDGEEDGA